MRAAHHSSAYDWQRHAAMRGATSGSGMGHGRTLLAKPRRSVRISGGALLLAGIVLMMMITMAWPR